MEVYQAKLLEENGEIQNVVIKSEEPESPAFHYDSENLKDVDCFGLIDTHCHLDFIFNRSKHDYKSFEDFKTIHHKEFPKSFAGCIAVFCEPQKWMKFGYEEKIMKVKFSARQKVSGA